MTPEAAHEMGKRVTLALINEMSGPLYDGTTLHDGTPAGLLATIEAEIEMADDAPNVAERPFALRGSAEFWEQFAGELRARAAAIEATR